MNFNEKAKLWEETRWQREPKWETEESSKLSVELAKKFYEERKRKALNLPEGKNHE